SCRYRRLLLLQVIEQCRVENIASLQKFTNGVFLNDLLDGSQMLFMMQICSYKIIHSGFDHRECRNLDICTIISTDRQEIELQHTARITNLLVHVKVMVIIIIPLRMCQYRLIA